MRKIQEEKETRKSRRDKKVEKILEARPPMPPPHELRTIVVWNGTSRHEYQAHDWQKCDHGHNLVLQDYRWSDYYGWQSVWKQTLVFVPATMIIEDPDRDPG